jgi:anti-sigma B factor antagonist
MEFSTSTQGDVIVAAIAGRLDSGTAPEAQEKLTPLIGPGAKLVLDMSGCEYVSSAGLRVLLWCAKAAARDDAQIAVAGLSNDIKEVMEMTGFGDLFPSFAGVDEAVASVKG